MVEIAGTRVGLTICEDAWEPGPPASAEAEMGAELIVNASGSPYLRGKRGDREAMFARRARECGTAFAFVNLVGGQDELVFDGSSVALGSDGEVLGRAKQFDEDFLVVEFGGEPARIEEPLSDLDEVYSALVTGLRDYVEKNGFRHVVVAVSGGIDSALVALVAADALGGDRLTGVVMPSPHSSTETQEDARAIVRNLGAELIEIPIEGAMGVYADALEGSLDGAGGLGGITAENLQARIRGNLMMALSNTHGWLVLTTGNKSEMSVGYATLYGDMAGGFAVIKDVPKTLVYDLVRHRNAQSPEPLVPPAVIERPPSAELRPDQRDDDSLPPYEVLDRILDAYIVDDRSRDEIVADGDDPADRRRGDPHGRPLRVQAPPGAARHPHHRQGLRPRPPPADHEPLRRLAGPAIATCLHGTNRPIGRNDWRLTRVNPISSGFPPSKTSTDRFKGWRAFDASWRTRTRLSRTFESSVCASATAQRTPLHTRGDRPGQCRLGR